MVRPVWFIGVSVLVGNCGAARPQDAARCDRSQLSVAKALDVNGKIGRPTTPFRASHATPPTPDIANAG